jgi:hypothetical protein
MYMILKGYSLNKTRKGLQRFGYTKIKLYYALSNKLFKTKIINVICASGCNIKIHSIIKDTKIDILAFNTQTSLKVHTIISRINST